MTDRSKQTGFKGIGECSITVSILTNEYGKQPGQLFWSCSAQSPGIVAELYCLRRLHPGRPVKVKTDPFEVVGCFYVLVSNAGERIPGKVWPSGFLPMAEAEAGLFELRKECSQPSETLLERRGLLLRRHRRPISSNWMIPPGIDYIPTPARLRMSR